MKVFLSYSHQDRVLAKQIKSIFEEYGARVFLAHDDLEPSVEWADRMFAEIIECHVLLPILTAHFDASDWTDQEVGIAYGQGKLIVPVSVDRNPHGFISRFQALKLRTDDIHAMRRGCRRIVSVICDKPVEGAKLRDAMIEKFGASDSYDEAGILASRLCSLTGYTTKQVTRVLRYTIRNSQIKGSFKAQRELMNFLRDHGDETVSGDLLSEFYNAIR